MCFAQLRNLWVLRCTRNSSTFVDHLHKIDIFIGEIDYTLCMFHHCKLCLLLYHQSVGMHNVMIEHVVETHHFVHFECSTLDLVCCSLGCTVVLGLKLGSRLEFLGWITGEIAPLSLPSIQLWLLFWPLLCAVTFTLHLALSFNTNSATSLSSLLPFSFASTVPCPIIFQFQNSSGFIVFQTEGKSQCLVKISAGFFLPATW